MHSHIRLTRRSTLFFLNDRLFFIGIRNIDSLILSASVPLHNCRSRPRNFFAPNEKYRLTETPSMSKQ